MGSSKGVAAAPRVPTSARGGKSSPRLGPPHSVRHSDRARPALRSNVVAEGRGSVLRRAGKCAGRGLEVEDVSGGVAFRVPRRPHLARAGDPEERSCRWRGDREYPWQSRSARTTGDGDDDDDDDEDPGRPRARVLLLLPLMLLDHDRNARLLLPDRLRGLVPWCRWKVATRFHAHIPTLRPRLGVGPATPRQRRARSQRGVHSLLHLTSSGSREANRARTPDVRSAAPSCPSPLVPPLAPAGRETPERPRTPTR